MTEISTMMYDVVPQRTYQQLGEQQLQHRPICSYSEPKHRGEKKNEKKGSRNTMEL